MPANELIPEATWNMVGQPLSDPISSTITAKEAQRYALASGDLNPLYFDEVAARSAGYRTTLVPPLFLSWALAPARPIEQVRTDGLYRGEGVRLTMNAERVPVIYEVLENHQNIGKIFVTQSIEAAALAEFGPALPGRRHAVERSLSEAPRVVVPRVIDDPPDFMGPILYLHAETHDVATLICRCMNAQVKALAGQRLYELVPAEASGNTFDATRLEAAHPRWLREDFINQTDRLTRSLRLPTGF